MVVRYRQRVRDLRSRSLFGLETEYGLQLERVDGTSFDVDAAIRTLIDHVAVEYRGQYLANGARFYRDTGSHPEYATPECSDLNDLVAADVAGQRLLWQCIATGRRALEDQFGCEVTVRCFKNNLDSQGATFGCHENYLSSRDIPYERLADILSPFLLTRSAFSGAGRVVLTGSGSQFRRTQRAPVLGSLRGSTSTHHRSMLLERDEPLADPNRWRRVHVLGGDSNLAQEATWLKVGTTALVMRAIEAGLSDLSVARLMPYSDREALDAVDRGDASYQNDAGTSVAVLDVQQRYRDWAACCVSGSDEAWVTEVLERWSFVLDALANDPNQLIGRLDWPTKLDLLSKLAGRSRRGFSNPKVAYAALQYHNLDPDVGLAQRLERSGGLAKVVSESQVRHAERFAPATRARVRGWAIRHHPGPLRPSWERLGVGGVGVWSMPDPFVADPRSLRRFLKTGVGGLRADEGPADADDGVGRSYGTQMIPSTQLGLDRLNALIGVARTVRSIREE